MNIQELSSAAGGVAQGFEAGTNMRINAQDAGIRKAEEDRKARDDALNEAFKQIFAGRPSGPDTLPPSPEMPPGALPTAPAGGAQTFPLPPNNAAPATPPPAGSPAAAPPALPASAAAGAAPSGQPTGPYRERYHQWRQSALQAAARVGGLQGAKLFNDYEDALARRQMLDYSHQAVTAMSGGNIGQAAKLLNTALEVSPVDLGMEWVAYDGKLYLKGGDGKMSSEPYNQAAVEEMVRRHLATPETYQALQELSLAERTQTETERANLEDEKIARGTLDVNERLAGVSERNVALDEKYRGRETAAREAQALADLIQAKAYAERVALANAADQAEANGWTPAQILQIMRDADSWEQDKSMLLPDSVEAFRDNPEEFVKLKTDVIEQMTANPPAGGPTREQAGFVSQLLRQTPGVDYTSVLDGSGKVKAGLIEFARDKKTGQVRVIYDGDSWILPPGLAEIALQMQAPPAASPAGDVAPPPSGALPTTGAGAIPFEQTPAFFSMPELHRTDARGKGSM